METGEVTKSASFNTPKYWVVKCDNPNLPGNRNGELPIDNRYMGLLRIGRKVTFEVVEIGNDDRMKFYARIID